MMFPFFYSLRQTKAMREVERMMRGRRFMAQRPRVPAPVDTGFFSRDRTGLLPVRVVVDRKRQRMQVRAFGEHLERVMFGKN